MNTEQQALENQYTKNAFIAAYNYLKGYLQLNEIPELILINITVEDGPTPTVMLEISDTTVTDLKAGDAGLAFTTKLKNEIFVPWLAINAVFSPSIPAKMFPILVDPFGLSVDAKWPELTSALVEPIPVERSDVIEKRSKIKLC